MHEVKPSNVNRVQTRFGGGDKGIIRLLDTPLFHAALSGLLIKAGWGNYNGVIMPGTCVKGTAHTKGLRIGPPKNSQHAIELFWHEGSNDSRASCTLSVPPGKDKFEFHAALKKAYDEIATVPDKQAPQKDQQIKQPQLASAAPQAPKSEPQNKNVVELFPQPDHAFKSPSGNAEFMVVDFGDETSPEETAEAAQPEGHTYQYDPDAGFVDESRNIVFFMGKLALDRQNEVSFRACSEILQSMGVLPKGCHPILTSLVKRGYLAKSQKPSTYGIGEKGLDLIPQTVRKQEEDPKPPVTTPAPEVSPTTLLAQAHAIPATSSTEIVARLKKFVETETKLRERRKVIDEKELPALQKRREALEAEARKLSGDQERIAKERNSINHALENPEFEKSRRELADLRKLLG